MASEEYQKQVNLKGTWKQRQNSIGGIKPFKGFGSAEHGYWEFLPEKIPNGHELFGEDSQFIYKDDPATDLSFMEEELGFIPVATLGLKWNG